jgi:hypothetical protein
MKRIAVLAALVSGCVSFEIYEPEGGLKTERARASCAQPMISTVQPLADGVSLFTRATRLGAKTSISLALEVPPGKQVSLSSSTLLVATQNSSATTFVLPDFTSGAPGFNVPRRQYPVDATLIGTDRMARLSPPYGPLERFYTSISIEGPAAPELVVSSPKILVGTVEVQPVPSRFVLTKASVGCVQ